MAGHGSPARAHSLDRDEGQLPEQGRRSANTQVTDQEVLPLVTTPPAADYIAQVLAQHRREKWEPGSLLDPSQDSLYCVPEVNRRAGSMKAKGTAE